MARSKTDTTTPSIDRRRRNPRGQAMAEFAIILPILLALVGGGIDFARAFEGAMTLQSAARNAAEAAAYTSTSQSQAETNARALVIKSEQAMRAAVVSRLAADDAAQLSRHEDNTNELLQRRGADIVDLAEPANGSGPQ